MKNRILPLIVTPFILLLISQSSLAQQWSEEEQELLDAIEFYWETWMEAVKKKDADHWFKKARPAENFSYWWTEQGSPNGPDAIKRDWDAISETDAYWVDIRPIAIRMHGDVGIVQFYGYWKAKTKDGLVTTEDKRTEVFIKNDGRWTFLIGQGTPSSAKDAEPYK